MRLHDVEVAEQIAAHDDRAARTLRGLAQRFDYQGLSDLLHDMPTPTLARRTIGETFEEFVANLYMPEELLRNRNRHEQRVYADEPDRRPGTGRVEAFRAFILALIRQNNRAFHEFHKAVAANTADAIRAALRTCRDEEVRAWLDTYLRK